MTKDRQNRTHASDPKFTSDLQPALCPACAAEVLVQIASAPGVGQLAFWCVHSRTAALVKYSSGAPLTWRLYGPLSDDQAVSYFKAHMATALALEAERLPAGPVCPSIPTPWPCGLAIIS